MTDPAARPAQDAGAISVSNRRWLERPHAARDALAISQQLGLPELMGRVLASRGVRPAEAQAYLSPTLRDFLPDPFHLKDMEKAARRIAEEIVASCRLQVAGKDDLQHATCNMQPTVAIFGDYDVDGATSSALLVRYLESFGIAPLVHIPDRMKEGYGPNTPALLALREKGAKLVITVDCGTMAFEPLAAARAAGLDVIVVDHHKGEARLPEAFAVINPNRADEASPHTQLAAVGVTFLLLVAVNKLLRAEGREVPDLLSLLDLVALGTICDVVPLTGVNRALVTQGLKVMRSRGNAGINAVMDVARLTQAPGTYHAGFILGPRINAGGRVGKSDLGVRLLTTDDAPEAAGLAQELDRFNAERRAIESLVQIDAMREALLLPDSDAVIMVAGNGWHAGVIGIVAGRLKEHFGKPSMVVALDGGAGKASARSIAGVDLGAAVIAGVQAGIIASGGGHAMAAGFSVAEDQLPRLRDFLNVRLSGDVAELTRERTLFIDGIVSLAGINVELARLIEKAGPFGAGNPSVRLEVPNVRVVNCGIAGDGHVRAILTDATAGAPSSGIKAMAFRSADTPVGQALLNARGRVMHVAGGAKMNLWQGRESVDFFIDDVMWA
jgi:single-stranded-DNA-specific exonuclease